MMFDPLDSPHYLRRTSEDECIDAQGRLYEVREKYRNRCDGSGFLAFLLTGGMLLLLL